MIMTELKPGSRKRKGSKRNNSTDNVVDLVDIEPKLEPKLEPKHEANTDCGEKYRLVFKS